MSLQRLPNTQYYKTTRNRKNPSVLLGFEYEVPLLVGNLVWDDSEEVHQHAYRNHAAFQERLPEHFLRHPDSGGIEVKTPVDDMGQQKRWAAYIFKRMEDLPLQDSEGSSIKTWEHNCGIHVHASQQRCTSDALKNKWKCLLRAIGSDVILRLSHRGISYRQNTDIERSCLRAKMNGRVECRLFNSHPALLLPAIEFSHACVTHILKGRPNNINAFRKTLKRKEYKNINKLFEATLRGDGHNGRPLWKVTDVIS